MLRSRRIMFRLIAVSVVVLLVFFLFDEVSVPEASSEDGAAPRNVAAAVLSAGVTPRGHEREFVHVSREMHVCVVDSLGEALSGATIRIAPRYDELYESGVSSLVSDRDGRGTFEVDSEVDPVLVMVAKEGHSVEVVAWHPRENREVVVALDKLEALLVEVSDGGDRAIVGASVSVRGRWGEEARQYERRAGKVLLKDGIYADAVTGADGHASVLLDSSEPYRIKVSCFGYADEEVTLAPEDWDGDSLKVAMYPVLAGGVSVPRELSGSVAMHGSAIGFQDGFSTLRMTKKERQEFEQALETRLGIGNTFWKFVVDRRPLGERTPVFRKTGYRAFPGSPTSRFNLPLKRIVDELGPWDIVEVEGPVRRLVRVDVEFRDRFERPVIPSSSMWGLVEGDQYRIVSIASGLPEDQCPDFSVGRHRYQFMVPEGEYSVKVISPLSSRMAFPEFEPVVIQAHQGLRRTYVVYLNEKNARVLVDCVDEFGREVKEYRVHLYCLNDSGRPDDKTCFVRAVEGPMVPKAVLPGPCFVEVEAFGYARQLFEYDLVAGRTEHIAVQLETLTDEWQNAPKMTLEALIK